MGEHTAVPLTPREDSEWTHRPDAFSTFRPGIAGLLTRSDGAWYYKRNINPLSEPPSPDWSDGTPTPDLKFDLLETVPTNPNLGPGDPVHFADLKGDGSISLVTDRGNHGLLC